MRRVLAVLLAVLLPVLAGAEEVPAPLTDKVSDYDEVLAPAEEERIAGALAQVRAETGVHVVLVTMARRADHGGADETIEDYALRLFNSWGVGDRERNDGVMILVARDDREMRVQLGSGFGADWDGVAQRVIDERFLPAFRRGDYVGGIEAGTRAVIDRIARPFAAGQAAPQGGGARSTAWDGWYMVPIVFLAAAAVALRTLIADWLVRFRPCPSCGKKGLRRTRQVLTAASYSSTGTGKMHTTCDFCDYQNETTYVIPQLRRRSSGSGGSGFGGGRSSGGGASGRW